MSLSVAGTSSNYAVDLIGIPQPVEKPDSSVPQAQTDTVKLSEAAQVKLLEQQGETPSAIAQILGISTSALDSLLYISTGSSTASVAVATSAPNA